MKFLEKDLEEIIFNTGNQELQERGLHILGKKYRQLRIGNYGIADLVTVERFPAGIWDKCKGELLINVIELKKDKIGISAFLQALGYVKGIKRYLSYRNFNHDVFFKITLIGKELDTSSTYCYLTDFMHDNDSFIDCCPVSNYTYKYLYNGIEFDEKCDYKLTNEGF